MNKLLSLSLSVGLFASLNLIAGCPSPDTVADGAGQPGGGPPPGGQPGAPQGGGGRPEIAGFQVEPGQGVKLSGTITYAGSKTGRLRVDFLKKEAGGSFPELVHTLTLDKAGPWTVDAPKDLGTVSIVSFLDADDNGPGPGEPAGMIEATTIAQADIAALDITLSDTPNLGSLAPPAGGGAGGEGAPPQGGPPPQGAQGGPPPQGAQGGPPPQGAQGGPPPQGAQGGPPPQGAQGGPPPQGAAPRPADPMGAAPAPH